MNNFSGQDALLMDCHRAIESHNHRTISVERDIKVIYFQSPPAAVRNIFREARLIKTPSNITLNTLGTGAFMASLDCLLQCPTTVIIKNFY